MGQMKTLKEIIKDQEIGITEATGYFDIDSVDKWMKEIEKGIVAPVVNVSKSTLGGADRVSITIKLSLDPKEDWINNIFHNSRYAMFDLDRDGSFQLFSRGLKLRPNKMRKSKVKSAKDVVNKVNTWIKGIKEGVEFDEGFFKVIIPDMSPTFIEAGAVAGVRNFRLRELQLVK